MKVSQFITLYKVRTKNMDISPDNVIKVVEELVHPKNYISFDNKCKLVEETIKSVQNFQYKTARRYRQFVINLIAVYTDLEMDEKGFDELSETRLLDIVLSTFQSEYQICTGIMTMYLDDEWS